MKNVLWVGAHSDRNFFIRLKDKLNELNINLNCVDDHIQVGHEWTTEIKKAISSASYIVFFISESALKSADFLSELNYSLTEAENRSKIIFPIIQWGDITFKNSAADISRQVRLQLETYQWIIPEDGLHSEEDYNRVTSYIDGIVSQTLSKQDLYEKIAAFSKMKYTEGIVLNAAKLFKLVYSDLRNVDLQHKKYDNYLEICRLVALMDRPFGGTDRETKEIAHDCITVVTLLKEALEGADFNTIDIFMVAVAKYLIIHLMRIWCNAIEILSNDDIHSPGHENVKKYTDLYDIFENIYQKQLKRSNAQEFAKTYSPEQIQFIFEANKLELTIYCRSEKDDTKSQGDNLQLVQIAEYLQKANTLFDELADKTQKLSFLRCLKTSYTRLQEYCEMGNCLKIGAFCVDKITEINRKIETLSEEQGDFSIEENAFRALLGFKTSAIGKYDVFISYKHEDLDIAYSVYHFINSSLLLPFFDAVTLPELANSEYEDAIMNAMENSSHFVVIITELEQLESYWIKLEMNTFHHEIVEGRKQNSNFIILVSDDVFEQIKESNKKCLNIKYRSYEIMRISQYKRNILGYLK